MNQSQDQAQTVQVLYELAMSIGTSLDLDKMLKASLLTFMKKLDCVVGSVYQYQKVGEQFRFAAVHTIPRHMPRNSTLQAALGQLPTDPDVGQISQFLESLPLVGQSEDGNHYHLLELPGFGVMILIKNKYAIDSSLLKLLRPLQEKLAAAANACLSETALRKAQEQSQTILESVTTPLLISRMADGRIMYANQLLAEMIGTPLEQLIGDVTPDFYANTTDRQTLLAALREQGALVNYELRLKRSDGELLWALISIRPFQYQGETALITTLIDITERKQTVQALEKSQARTQLILESVTLPLLISRISDGTVLYANERISEMMGMTLEDVIGKQTPNFYSNPDDRQAILKGIRDYGGNDNKELSIVGADSQPLWVLLSNRRMEYDGEMAIITTLTDITARKLAEEALTKRATELETVAQVSASASTILETDALLQEVVDLTKERFNLYHAHIYLFNRSDNNLILAAGAGDIGRQMVAEKRRISLAQEQSLVAQAARSKRGIIENDVRNNPAFLPHPLLPDTQAEMAVPMLVGDRVVGVLDVQSRDVDHFTQQDVTVNTTLAAQIGVALENARSFEAAQASLSETQALLDISRETSRTLELENILEIVLDQLLVTTKFDIGLISVVKPGTNSLELVSQRLPDALAQAIEENGLDGTLCDLVYTRNEAIVVVDLAADSPVDSSGLVDMGYASYQGVPIEAKGNVLGTICLFSAHRLTSAEANIIFLQAVGQQVGVTIQNARLFEQTQLALQQAKRSEEALAKQAEELSELTRRLTREGWQDYLYRQPVEQTGFVFESADFNFTKPIVAAVDQALSENSMATAHIQPINIRGETIGRLAVVADDNDAVIDPETVEILDAITEQLGMRIDNLRLTDQTQTALAETEMLYKVSERLSESRSYDNVLDVLRQDTIAGRNTHIVSLSLFDRPYTEAQTPEWVDIPAYWTAEPAGEPRQTRHKFADYEWPPASEIIQRPEISFTENVATDPDLNEKIRESYLKGNARSTIVLPLVVGEQWVGYVNMLYPQKVSFTDSEINLLNVLIRQMAVVVQSISLLNAARARAQQEQTLRQITQRIRSSADVETIMRTAVQEIGRTLGRKTYIYLGDDHEA